MTGYSETYNTYKAMLEEHFESYFRKDKPFPEPSIRDAMAYSLLGGGKRVRGVLLLAFYRMYHEDVRPALPFAAALEMVHAYSLVHDDLPCMDDDDTRRGKPACHIRFGEAAALLAGDGLLTLAFSAMARAGDVPAERALECVARLAAASGGEGMILGQRLDLAGEGKRLGEGELDELNGYKTGCLISAAACMGCILAGAGDAEVDAAGGFAMGLALAFQIMDDVLDVTADPALLGKPVGSDRGRGKNTYAALIGVDACRRRVDALTKDAIETLAVFGGRADFLRRLAEELSGREY